MKIDSRKLFSVLGIIAPGVVFFGIVLLSVSWQGFNFISEYASVLGSVISPFRHVVNIFGFGLFGIFMMGFTYPLGERLNKNYFSDTATRLFLAGGLLISILGIFPIDPEKTRITLDGKLHSLIGTIAFIGIPISIIWYALAFGRDREWGSFWKTISFILAGVGLTVAVILKIEPNYIYAGIVEMTGIGANLLWIFFVSVRLWLEFQFGLK